MTEQERNGHHELPAKVRVRVAIAMIVLTSAFVTILTYLAA